MSSLLSAHSHKLDLASELMEIIPRAMREIRASNRSRGGAQMPLPHYRVLANIWRIPKTNKELAEDLGLSVAATSRLISALEERGLVKRASDEVDRRAINVSITKMGLQLFTSIRSGTCHLIAERLNELSSKEQAELEKGLRVISKTMLGISN
jgi:DNA-binding MarR family transcriptional regulator